MAAVSPASSAPASAKSSSNSQQQENHTLPPNNGATSRSDTPSSKTNTNTNRLSRNSHDMLLPGQSVYFDKAVFSSASFNADVLLTAVRVSGTLPGLKNELQGFLTTLKRDLIELINKDYADFVNLSANLVGMDKGIDSIRNTLTGVREDISHVRTEVEKAMSALSGKLTERAAIREKKALLQTFLNIIDSVHKIEGLLHLNTTAGPKQTETKSDGNESVERHGSLSIADVSQIQDDSTQTTERVAGEFNQLQFYVSQCREVPIVQALSPRIDTITRTLLAGLEASFRTALEDDNLDLMVSVLRPYAIVEKAGQAEDLFRAISAKNFVKRTVTSANLSKHGLEWLYNEVVMYTDMDCKTLLTAAEQVGPNIFQFLVNSLWPTLVEAMTEVTPEVFAAGIPDQFYLNYTCTKKFINRFSEKIGSPQSVALLKNSTSYIDFMKSWSLPIYYQLRFQEIAGMLEESLQRSHDALFSELVANANDHRSKASGTHPSAVLDTTKALCEAVNLTWSDGVFLPALSHRFWKLQFQLMSRFTVWLSDTISDITAPPSDASAQHLEPNADPLGAAEPQSPLTKAQVSILLLNDVECIAELAKLEWQNTIFNRLSESVGQLPPDFVPDGLSKSVERLKNKSPLLIEGVKTILTEMMVAKLNPVWRITATYRMTNKPMPTVASPYAPGIFAPLNDLNLNDEAISPELSQSITAEVLNTVAASYSEIVTEVLNTVNKTEASLLRLKKRGRKHTGAQVDVVTDESKIRRQLYIDALDYKDKIWPRNALVMKVLLWTAYRHSHPGEAAAYRHSHPGGATAYRHSHPGGAGGIGIRP
ncbi:hypothetical protein SARC_01366 [Sphaeroforma arctica JP610]|uniref:Conserved oligomeric Golgi complex subunit 2 n=1 Tax=Sphaeroforma arctica JP610 TaxID=667725 RepID=A0A0L0GBX6_9EUKA|nr:hypothetical protein SARC_01366 [Sphaeroforma arctica JP610]KNC86495.1 hypothetical protein SARC_01366 [Sphaeroforma arctica JP610]|eukprot:XP_014160397.1 hypothetical protein SARC_01366 [Sphaeroforma arctica JP610]